MIARRVSLSAVIDSYQGELTPEQATSAQLIISKPSANSELVGDMWLANLDGTLIEQLPVETGINQRDFIRVAPSIRTGNPALYYAAGAWEGDKTIWRLDLATRESVNIGTIPKCCANQFGPSLGPRTDVSPDGRYIILFRGELLDKLVKHDLATGEDTELNAPGEPTCTVTCQSWNIEWSPNGKYLMASRGTINDEPGGSLILDSWGEVLARADNWVGVWSPEGDAFCDVSNPDRTSPPHLEIRSAPDWSPKRYLQEVAFNEVNAPTPVFQVDTAPVIDSCTWVDEGHVAVWQSAVKEPGSYVRADHILVLDVAAGEYSAVTVNHNCNFESLMSTGTGSLLAVRNSLAGQRCGGPYIPNGPNDVIDLSSGKWTTTGDSAARIEAVIPAADTHNSLRTAARPSQY